MRGVVRRRFSPACHGREISTLAAVSRVKAVATVIVSRKLLSGGWRLGRASGVFVSLTGHPTRATAMGASRERHQEDMP